MTTAVAAVAEVVERAGGVHPGRRPDPGEQFGRGDLGEGGDQPVAAVLAEHRGLEPAIGGEFDDDAVDRRGHAARAPEMREVGGFVEAAPHQLARPAEDPPVDEFVVVSLDPTLLHVGEVRLEPVHPLYQVSTGGSGRHPRQGLRRLGVTRQRPMPLTMRAALSHKETARSGKTSCASAVREAVAAFVMTCVSRSGDVRNGGQARRRSDGPHIVRLAGGHGRVVTDIVI